MIDFDLIRKQSEQAGREILETFDLYAAKCKPSKDESELRALMLSGLNSDFRDVSWWLPVVDAGSAEKLANFAVRKGNNEFVQLTSQLFRSVLFADTSADNRPSLSFHCSEVSRAGFLMEEIDKLLDKVEALVADYPSAVAILQIENSHKTALIRSYIPMYKHYAVKEHIAYEKRKVGVSTKDAHQRESFENLLKSLAAIKETT